jgi:hypothetical protein
MAIKRGRILTVNFTLILIKCLKDKFVAQNDEYFTVQNNLSKILL